MQCYHVTVTNQVNLMYSYIAREVKYAKNVHVRLMVRLWYMVRLRYAYSFDLTQSHKSSLALIVSAGLAAHYLHENICYIVQF